jgi:transposase
MKAGGHGLRRGESGYKPVVPPKWNYDKELYKRRNEIERFLRRLKGFRGIRACQ